MIAERHHPEHRRPHFVELVTWLGAAWLIGVGLNRDGVAVEVFADPADPQVAVAPEIVTFVHESCITASHLLQRGVRAEVHAERIAGQAPAILTLALRAAAETERRAGAAVREIAAALEDASR